MTTKADFDYSAEHYTRVMEQNKKALEECREDLFQTTMTGSTYRTNADIVRSNPVVNPLDLERAMMKDELCWFACHRHFLHEKLIATEKELKALKKDTNGTVTGVGRLIRNMCGGDEDMAKTILKTQTETGVTQFHTCDECHRYCYTGGDLYPDGYTCADCDDNESDDDDESGDEL